MYRIGIDLGGTTVKAGIVDEAYRIIRSGSVPTVSEKGAGALVKDMADLVRQFIEDAGITWEEIQSAGLGVPGTANKETGMMEYANNLCFENEALIPLLESHFHKPVFFTNDANAAAWGEFIAGCGKGARSLIMVTLGTGIGGGIIINGELYEGCNYAAGEFGHFTIQCEGLPCNCGRKGCFETYASATALKRMAREAMEKDSEKKSILWEMCGQDIENAGGAMIFRAAKEKDPTAVEVREKYLHYLSIGITDIINIFQPEILCIGGGVSNAGDDLLKPLCRLTDEKIYTRTSKIKTEIKIASLGNDAGIIGAAFLK